MKKSILLTSIALATPIIAIAPITTSCSNNSSSDDSSSHFSGGGSSGGGGGGGSGGGGTSTTESGVQTTNFNLTLKKEVSDELSVTATTTSGPTVSVVSTSVSGKNVTVTCRINVSDMSTAVSSKFNLTFHCESWSSDETITGFTISYTKIQYQDAPTSAYTVDTSGKLTSIAIPSGTTRLSIPNTVKVIPKGVLDGKLTSNSDASTKVKSIVIPSSVVTIEEEAISNNSSLNNIDISDLTEIPSGWGKNIFKGSSSTGTLKYNADNRETVYSWAMYNSGLNHQWITDTSWKCERYINDRTFSLMGQAVAKCAAKGWTVTPTSWGTAWILSDATPNIKDDYIYYVGTNWHVKAGAQSCHMDFYDEDYNVYKYQSGTYRLYYGDKSTQKTYGDETGLDSASNTEKGSVDPCYTCFNADDTDGIWENESNFRTGNTTVTGYKDAVDFSVCKINFNNMVSSGAKMPDTIKTKLDNLNNWNNIYGNINKFATMSSAKNKNKWIGGFPFDQSSAYELAKWENHSISGSEMSQYAAYHDDGEAYDMAHLVNDDIGGTDVDFTAQYKFNNTKSADWMAAGASGSPLITTDLEVCGIYWGGQLPSASETDKFFPMFSILNDTSYKDFVANYI